MNVNSKSSSFQSIILELIRQKLNMMLTEIFQLNKNVDSNNYEKLTKIILKEIANGHINSCHMSPEHAKKTIQILEQMNTHKEVRVSMEKDGNKRRFANPFEGVSFS